MADNIFQKVLRPSARGRLWQIFSLIIVLVIIFGVFDLAKYYNKGVDWLGKKTHNTVVLPHVKEIPFRLGLDLQGGTQLIYKADVSQISSSDSDSAVQGVRDVVERRINLFGVSEPVVQVNKTADGEYQIIAELAGVQDVNEAIKMIGETPLLQFKEKAEGGASLTADQQKQLDDSNKKAKEKAEDVLGKVLSGGDFSVLAKDFSEDSNTKDKGGDLGWLTERGNSEIVSIAKNLDKGQATKDLTEISTGYEIIKLDDMRDKKDPLTDKNEKEVEASHILICYKDISGCESGLTKDDAYKKIKELKEKATPANFDALAKENSTEPGADQTGGNLGWFGKGDMVKPFEDTVFDQQVGTISYVVETQFGYHLINKKAERNLVEYKISHIFIDKMTKEEITGQVEDWKNTELTGKNLKRASIAFNPNDGTPEVSLEFDSEGSTFFENITQRNIGKPVAIFLDGYAISMPTVNEKITGGQAIISGKFDLKEAKLLAERLNAGALPVPIELVSQKTVGASLGQQSIADSMKAGLVGLLLVALFMIFLYRLPGLLAVISLLIYGVLVLFVFKIWSVTLTLAGMAGFILSIGIAVDANVLIFERMKEEIRAGRSLLSSIEEGFRRAWPSIRDGNISTLITCVILFSFSASIIKGFAIILALGVLVSMLTAIIVTKNFLSLIAGEWLEKRMWLVGAKKKEKVDNE